MATRPIHSNVHSVDEARKALGDVELARSEFETRIGNLESGSASVGSDKRFIVSQSEPTLPNARILSNGEGIAVNLTAAGIAKSDLRNLFAGVFFSSPTPIAVQ